MSFTSDEHSIRIGGQTVAVSGETGMIESTWTLAIDGREVDRAKASGSLVLESELDDGSAVQASVRQGAFGPTEVTIHHDGEEITRFKGFVA
jgi:hypothetical protein